jgi:G3E family GTPase
MMRAAQNGVGVLSASRGIPLTIVAGEPAAGKSTLLAHLMAASPSPRVAAVMNAASVRALEPLAPTRIDGDSVRLPGGALCCGLAGDFADSLARLNESPDRPGHVFIEISTIAELRRARGYAYMPGYRPCGIVMVVGAETVSHSRIEDLPEKLDDASVVIMNKLDTIPEDTAVRAEAWLRRHTGPPILCSQNGDIAPPLLVGFDQAHTTTEASVVSAQWSPELSIAADDPGPPRRRRPVVKLSDCCRVWSLEWSEPVDTLAFRRWIERLPPSVLRGSGVLVTRTEPHVRYRFDLMGAHWGLERDGHWRDEPRVSRIVLVGL